MVVHVFHSLPGKVETGISGVQSHPWLRSKIESNLGYLKPYFWGKNDERSSE